MLSVLAMGFSRSREPIDHAQGDLAENAHLAGIDCSFRRQRLAGCGGGHGPVFEGAGRSCKDFAESGSEIDAGAETIGSELPRPDHATEQLHFFEGTLYLNCGVGGSQLLGSGEHHSVRRKIHHDSAA
jgi:hypothetical protein